MWSKRTLSAAAAAQTLLLATGGPAWAGQVLDFEDLVLGTEYLHGAVFTTGGVDITVDTFFFSNGDPFDGGFSEVDAFGNAGGAGNELEINNVNLSFDFGVELTNLSLFFGEFGGNINFDVNGDFFNLNDFADLPGTVGGAAITVTDFGGGQGLIEVVGNITAFAIGGQELWIDDVAYRPIPGPGAIGLIAVAGLVTPRRRRAR